MRGRLKYGFSVISNIRNPITRSINRRTTTYDSNISRYQDIYIMAYTEKRRFKKEQIPSKIAIQQPEIPQIQRDLSMQLEYSIDLIPLDAMSKQYEKMQITSSYVFSKFNEKGMKELFEGYSRKVLLNGRMPPIKQVEKYNKHLEKIIGLYKLFYYGEEISKLEQFIESQYLNLKLVKHGNYLKSGAKSIKRRNELLKCIWNDENQRSLEGYKNWQSRPFDDYADFRPFFNEILVMKSNNPNDAVLSQNLIVSPDNYLNSQNVEFVSIQLFNRIIEWCGCLEFNRVLKLPVDFLIELSFVSVHIWMLLSRLSRDKNTASLIKSLQKKFKLLVKNKLGEISAETRTAFDENVYQKFMMHWAAYEVHFRQSTDARENLRSLVYSTVFLSKVDKDSDTVALFSQYLALNHSYLQSLPLSTILKGNIQFDVYLIPPDYKSNNLSPVLSQYPFKNQHKQILSPIQKPNLELEKPSFATKLYRWMIILTKGLKSYDYYSQVEKQEKENEELEKIGWDLKNDVEEEFQKVKRLREKRKK